METIWQDAKYALRTLAKRPGFTAVAVLTLAIGVGATTSIFSLVNAVLIERLPYPEAERLVSFHDVQSQLAQAPASFPELADWQQHGEALAEIGAYFEDVVTLTGDGAPERFDAVRTSASLVTMLGLTPAAGRLFNAADEPPTAERVAVVSHQLWQRRFGADPALVGRSLRLNGDSVEIVGVLAPGLAARMPIDLFTGVDRDVWLPLRLDEERAPRGLHFLNVVGRLRGGLTAAGAASEVEALAARLREDGRTRHGIGVRDLREVLIGDARTPILMLFGAMGFVLLIGCANVANLLLARASVRRREIAVRMALGASRWRMVRQLVTESLILATAAGALGIVAVWWGLRSLAAAGLEDLPRPEMFTIDARVLAFALALSLATALIFGLAPAFQATAGRLVESFKEAGRQAGAGLGRHRTRSLLVVAEVSLSLVLLIGAGLLIRSFSRLMDQELGFEPGEVLTFRLHLPISDYPEALGQVAFFDQLLERLSALPGVATAAIVNNLPVTGGPSGSFTVEGITWPEDDRPHSEKRRVSPDYFRTLGIPLLQGRFFEVRDRAESPQVTIVNREFARLYFPDQNPIGRRIDFQWNSEGMQEIVGVVGNVRHRSLDGDYRPATYVPYAQNTQSSMRVVVGSALASDRPLGGNRGGETQTSPRRRANGTLIEAIRREVLAVDPDRPLAAVRTMDEVVASTLATRRLATNLLSAFATVALLLAALGIYGVMSYSTAQRTHEMGIRMALGAQRWALLRLVMGWGMKLAAAGIVIGFAGALALTRYMSAALFGVAPTDPVTFTAVAAILLVAAVTACYLPASRASRVDPVVALRDE